MMPKRFERTVALATPVAVLALASGAAWKMQQAVADTPKPAVANAATVAAPVANDTDSPGTADTAHATAQSAKSSPELAQVRALLQSAGVAHRALHSFAAGVEITINGEPAIKGKFSYRNPNRANAEVFDANLNAHQRLALNGSGVFLTDSRDPQHYLKQFPKGDSDEGAVAIFNLGHVSVSGLLPALATEANAPEEVLKGVRSAQIVPAANGAVATEDGVPVDVVKITNDVTNPVPATIDATISIGKADHLVRRVQLIAVQTSGAGKNVIDERYSNVRANPALAESEFAYAPGKGVTLADISGDEGTYDPRITIGAHPFPVAGKDLTDKPVSLSQYKGKVVLLDFWATWCPPCRAEAPNILAAYNKFHGKGFDVLAVNLDKHEDRAKAAAFVKEQHLSWHHIYDGKWWESPNAKAYALQALPFAILIGRDGKIQAVNPFGDQLQPAIQAALAHK